MDPGTSHRFRKVTLSTEFTCEGASHGDFDRDGVQDVVAGPYWYAGPTFSARHRLYPPMVFDPKGYSDCFFAFVRDFNSDGWDDVLVVGFPGQAASWLENPKQPGVDMDWQRHPAFDIVDNEAPTFTDLTGDGAPELVFTNGGRLGWAAPDAAAPAAPWTFHPLSPAESFGAFTHGLGVGDVDGDGRADVLEATGWWKQPASLSGEPLWQRRPQSFGAGGAQMLVVDVDGDGSGDVITSLAAHGSGLAWYEQGASATFTQHVIVSPDEASNGFALHEPHALALADIDADGLPDIVTGERFWGHVPAGRSRLRRPCPALLVPAASRQQRRALRPAPRRRRFGRRHPGRGRRRHRRRPARHRGRQQEGSVRDDPRDRLERCPRRRRSLQAELKKYFSS